VSDSNWIAARILTIEGSWKYVALGSVKVPIYDARSTPVDRIGGSPAIGRWVVVSAVINIAVN
jgi:hypothetical protein